MTLHLQLRKFAVQDPAITCPICLEHFSQETPTGNSPWLVYHNPSYHSLRTRIWNFFSKSTTQNEAALHIMHASCFQQTIPSDAHFRRSYSTSCPLCRQIVHITSSIFEKTTKKPEELVEAVKHNDRTKILSLHRNHSLEISDDQVSWALIAAVENDQLPVIDLLFSLWPNIPISVENGGGSGRALRSAITSYKLSAVHHLYQHVSKNPEIIRWIHGALLVKHSRIMTNILYELWPEAFSRAFILQLFRVALIQEPHYIYYLYEKFAISDQEVYHIFIERPPTGMPVIESTIHKLSEPIICELWPTLLPYFSNLIA